MESQFTETVQKSILPSKGDSPENKQKHFLKTVPSGVSQRQNGDHPCAGPAVHVKTKA